MSSSPSSVVMGVTAGLPPAWIEPFAGSLRATGYRGRLVLVAAGYGAADLASLRALADDVISVDDRFPPAPERAVAALRWLRGARRIRRLYPLAFRGAVAVPGSRGPDRWASYEFALEGLQSLRYAIYRESLISRFADADHVLVTDVRDVLFQRDPFGAPPARLEVFLEEAHVTIGSEPFNRRWIKRLYGEDTLGRLAAETVSCSGTVIGPRADMLRYLESMSGEIAAQSDALGSHDQGIHNFLLRSGRLPPADIIMNGTGRVLTMGAMRSIKQDGAALVLNEDGGVPAVLHQYDRHPELEAALLHRLRTVKT